MKLSILTRTFALLAGLLLSSPALHADENLWLYTRGVETRPDGTWEFKLMDTSRIGKKQGDYYFNDIRAELEYGLTDRLTLTGDVLLFDHHYSDVPWSPLVDTQGGPGGSFDDTQYAGYDIGFKYNILSPFKDPIGLAVGFAYEDRRVYRLDGAKIDQYSLVPKLYVQKNFLDNTLIWSFSGKMELERRKSPGVLEEEIAFDLATGLSYRISPKWFIGLESRFQSDFLTPIEDGVEPEGKTSNWDWDSFRLGDQFQYGLYVGPSVHYAGKNWWATVGALWQVKGWSADGAAASSNGKNWDEHEQLHVGVILGWEFGNQKEGDLTPTAFGKGIVGSSK